MNRGFISKYLCENKDKPILQCEGKCYLMKMLKKAANEEEQEKNRKLTQIKRLEVSETPFVFQFKFKSQVSESLNISHQNKLLQGKLEAVFRPPKCNVFMSV